MAPHSSTLAWRIPWTEEPGGLQSMGSLRVGHDWATSLSLFTFMHWRMKWQPTPVFLPGESQGRGSLVGCRLWGRTESDTWLKRLSSSVCFTPLLFLSSFSVCLPLASIVLYHLRQWQPKILAYKGLQQRPSVKSFLFTLGQFQVRQNESFNLFFQGVTRQIKSKWLKFFANDVYFPLAEWLIMCAFLIVSFELGSKGWHWS